MQLRRCTAFLILQVILLSSCAPQNSPKSELSSIDLKDCVLSAPGIDEQIDAQCGVLAVSEDPSSNSQGRQLKLNIAVVPAVKRTPEPDPLFVLVGGPGQSATETYPAISSTLFRIHEVRDIVLVDQRGTGKSNPLRCLDPEQEVLEDEQVLAQLRNCPKKLDADLRYYTTDIAMQDLDKVRSALGYEMINLYGASYGTRAALVYLKMYPTRVRSVILDAVVDPAFVLYQDAAQDGQKALELFFARCEVDDVCRSTYPNLRSEFDTVLEKLSEGHKEITISHPVTGEPLQFPLTRRTFTSIVFNTLYLPDLVAMLPLAIHEAYAQDNYSPLITQAFLLDAGLYDGMFYAVACTEDAPLIKKAPEEADSLFGSNVQSFLEVCNAWPKNDPPAIVHESVSSDVPVLMLSGEADPITPPWHAKHLSDSLRNSLHLIFKGMGHGNSGSECTAKILKQFIDNASLKSLDTDCVKNVEPPPFFVDFSGPQP